MPGQVGNLIITLIYNATVQYMFCDILDDWIPLDTALGKKSLLSPGP